MRKANKRTTTAKVIPIRQELPAAETKYATVAYFAEGLEEKLKADFIRWAGPLQGLLRKEKQAVWQHGRNLIEIKKLLRHGEFGRFIEQCMPYCVSTAQNYMRVARGHPKGPPEDDKTYRELYYGKQPKNLRKLAEEFGEPPFDVLDGRSERWKARKRFWLSLGIASERHLHYLSPPA